MTRSKTQEVLSGIVGEKCQGTLFVAGGTLILYIGDVQQKMSQDTPLKTTWYFWIECAWRVYDGNRIVTGCYDDAEFVCKHVTRLEDGVLIDVKHEEMSHDLKLRFSNGMQLELFSDSTTDDQWRLRRADGYCYGIEANLIPREWMEEPDE